MSVVTVVLRFRHADGSRTHHTAIVTPNGRLRPFWGMVGDQPTHLPGSIYYLREGQRVWEQAGIDPARVLTVKLQREHQLRGAELGIALFPSYPVGKSRGLRDRRSDPPRSDLPSCPPSMLTSRTSR